MSGCFTYLASIRGLQTHPSQEPLIYKKFFERISIWNQKYDYKPGENDEFSGIQTIDKLYEKFCLFKIIDIIIDSGYELINSNQTIASLFFQTKQRL